MQARSGPQKAGSPSLRVELGRPVVVSHAQLQALAPRHKVVAVEVVASVNTKLWRTGRSMPTVRTVYAHRPAMPYLGPGDVLSLEAVSRKPGRAFLSPLVEAEVTTP